MRKPTQFVSLSIVLILSALFQAFESNVSATVIGGWNSARAGSAGLEGSYAAATLTAIQAEFPDVTFSGSSEITDAFLANVDVMAVWAIRNLNDFIVPLSNAEQTALMDFIANGGAAILFGDGDLDSGSEAANASIFDPFGVTVTGLVSGTECAEVITPASHPITNGPFGLLSRFDTWYPGWFSELGPWVTPLATLDANDEATLAIIPAGTIAPGSGPVVLFSDVAPFALSILPEDEALVLNTTAFLIPEPSASSLIVIAIICAVAWRELTMKRRCLFRLNWLTPVRR